MNYATLLTGFTTNFIFIIFKSLWFIHGLLLNIDIALISIKLLLVNNVNKNMWKIQFFHTIYME